MVYLCSLFSKIDWNAVSAVTTAVLTFAILRIERGRDRREHASQVRQISKMYFSRDTNYMGVVQSNANSLRRRFPDNALDIMEGYEEAALEKGLDGKTAVRDFAFSLNGCGDFEWPYGLDPLEDKGWRAMKARSKQRLNKSKLAISTIFDNLKNRLSKK